jgi:AcrR family transcriptional regulator
MSNDASPAKALGRPRDARADRAIIAATLELIADRGVRELRMGDVAQRAGVGKAAIYRRYRSKDELVSDAVATLVSEIAIPDTGSTRADLLALMNAASAGFSAEISAPSSISSSCSTCWAERSSTACWSPEGRSTAVSQTESSS